MRSELYLDSYKRYKNGTNAVAMWLANTAAKFDIKFRSSRDHYILPIGVFSRLATTISLVADVPVPRSFIDSLKDALFLRKEANRWFQCQSGDEAFKAANDRHVHVVSVLEEVLRTLNPLREPATQHAYKNSSQRDAPKKSNIFKTLQVEIEDADDDGDNDEVSAAPPPPKIRSTPSPQREEAFEAQTSESDLPFAIFCFFNDLQEIRKYLKDIWQQYKDRKIGLMSVAITTDIAFDMVKQKEEEFRDNFSIPRDVYMSSILFDFYIQQRNPPGTSRHPLKAWICLCMILQSMSIFLASFTWRKKSEQRKTSIIHG
ncbi:hypothetical protein BDV96DRAFT_652930 [Lophiotrema nucula]|uniref:DUF6604 domain-containing protein n=1 Tax=Lophiotrema nucula TaxID=690887 RepID=A0A6A5YMP0_9PLEO|nr:hypothetical protein BDV96DRAFT_652930 [Lophiotrema nucula]